MIQTAAVIVVAVMVSAVLYWPLLMAGAGAEYLRWMLVQKWSNR